MTGSDLNSVYGFSDQTTMWARQRESQALPMLRRRPRDRRLPGSAHDRRIKRAAVAQKTLWFALALPTHAEMRAYSGALARPVVPVFCGFGSGADDLIIQSYGEARDGATHSIAVGLPVFLRGRAGFPTGGIPVVCVLGARDDITASQLDIRVHLRPGMFLSRSKWL